ncbi:PLP-dependent aminotransferase family protein [Methylobacterium currus]|uniref:MocR-like pyridoxine biosynthesis transcription factor PdxR n=1 Tax=Methylobacterium currus TaxID=2051553 RepID=UPI001E3DA334|nr:PLP-dependent aminotransferase family protein [Methylobacterium currus]UHC17874.1 PLP-dependent aminotransferase family protein [Methylobacterium currus]
MIQSRARSGWADLLDVTIEQGGDRSLFQQIYLSIRDAIVSERLAANSRLPSTRELARRLKVSRTSVLSAYEQLLAEGYVSGRPGSGTYVCDVLPAPMTPDASIVRGSDTPEPRRPALSEAGQRYTRFAAAAAASSNVPFATGCCSIDPVSIETWRRTARRVGLSGPGAFAYTDPIGEPALRQQIAQYLGAARAVNCEADQIVVLAGAQQAIDISIRTLIDPGDAVWVEDPGYLATREALAAAGCRIVPVPVDEQGLDVRAGIAAAPSARAVYITPSHQYPTGSVMSMQRRMELLAWATETGAWVIEDDYDSEFRYVGRPLAALQGLDRGGCVIYVGTFSKVLFPGLRLGFAVLPLDLVDAFRGARFLIDRHPPFFQQAMIADFMKNGFLSSHLRRLRQHYRAARDVLVDAVRRHMGDLVDVEVPECGMQLAIHFRDPVSDVAVAAAARRRGVTARAVSPHYIDATPRQGLLLGYSGFDAHRLRSAVIELAGAVREVQASGLGQNSVPEGTVRDIGKPSTGPAGVTAASRPAHAASPAGTSIDPLR